jgi:hypothetical protein
MTAGKKPPTPPGRKLVRVIFPRGATPEEMAKAIRKLPAAAMPGEPEAAPPAPEGTARINASNSGPLPWRDVPGVLNAGLRAARLAEDGQALREAEG